MNVPFVDLKAQYATIKEDIKKEIEEVLDNTAFILGKKVQDFEESFAEFCNSKYAIAVNSGTSALHLALLIKGIKEGDEVITVPNTFIATAEAISYCGATPIFVDIDPKTYNIDVTKIESVITNKTKAILPVHLYGQPADMDKIMEIAKKHNLEVIEDCCQSHGAEYKGKRIPVSSIGCFSFYPGKNLGAYGEGGAVVTDDKEIAEKIKILRDHGQEKKYYHKYIGYNYRMDGFQGAVLGVKLKQLDKWTELRRKAAKRYNELLKDVVETPFEYPDNRHVYHLYVVRVKQREELIEFLNKEGIASGLHYPVPLHMQEAYSFLNIKKGTYPVTEKYTKEIVSLPMYPEITNDQINSVCDHIKRFYGDK